MAFGPKLEFDKPLSLFTSFKTGGPARYFIAVSTTEELTNSLQQAKALGIPHFLIGGGSNLLISDLGYNGLIIRLEILGLKLLDATTIHCGAGEDLMALVNFSADNSLAGLEFSSGIWGTVGGAIYGNAGAYGGEIKDVLTGVTLVDREGKVKQVAPEYCRFAYRDSYLKITKEVVADCTIRLQPGNKQEIRNRIDEIIAIRKTKHPDSCSAGSFFKNIPDPTQPYGKLPAGKLLEEIGSKMMSVGGAKVYEKHANIIINGGNATSQDIRDLADILKQKVFDRFGVMLEEEVQHLGQFRTEE
jgi:UDP-N-acetylmuramate dehydrogenase